MLTNWVARERLPIGFSRGVATSEPARPCDAATLVERADRDMYREKERHHAETGSYARPDWPAPRSTS